MNRKLNPNYPHFNPLPSREGRRPRGEIVPRPNRFQSTPLTRGETHRPVFVRRTRVISIHSPHARGDPGQQCSSPSRLRIRMPLSIHSPHARGDAASQWLDSQQPSATCTFQSTPLTRGETSMSSESCGTSFKFQSTPLTRGETARGNRHARSVCVFQSTPLTRGETTDRRAHEAVASAISIHSPHARGDSINL